MVSRKGYGAQRRKLNTWVGKSFMRNRVNRRSQSRSYTVARTIAPINNVQANQATVQAILAIHNPGAATGWNQVSHEYLTGNALLLMFQTAFSGTLGAQIAGISISAKSEPSLNVMLAYKENANVPYRVISGIGGIRSYFKMPVVGGTPVLPDHIVLIAEAATTYRFKFYLSKSTIRSAI